MAVVVRRSSAALTSAQGSILSIREQQDLLSVANHEGKHKMRKIFTELYISL